jgi:hypothetical protein
MQRALRAYFQGVGWYSSAFLGLSEVAIVFKNTSKVAKSKFLFFEYTFSTDERFLVYYGVFLF